MDLTEALPLTSTATVEVSGWDERETFFVERSELSSDDFANNYISLEHRLLEGAIVFIRALQATYILRPSPVPFEVELLGYDSDGRQQFRLSAAHPRRATVHDPYSVN
jgi:hypothetical protein